MEYEFLPGTVRQKIRDLLERNGISQTKLAKLLGIGSTTVNNFLLGKTQTITSENVLKIAGLFNVSTDFLLGLTNDPRPRTMELTELQLSGKATQNLKDRCYDPRLLSIILENPELAQNLYRMLLSWSQPHPMGVVFDD